MDSGVFILAFIAACGFALVGGFMVFGAIGETLKENGLSQVVIAFALIGLSCTTAVLARIFQADVHHQETMGRSRRRKGHRRPGQEGTDPL